MKNFFKNAFANMKRSAQAQHEVDKANFEAVKAESRANFEENRGRHTFAKAKADSKKHWEDAHITSAQQEAKAQQQRDAQICAAKARTAAANARLENAKQQ